MSMVPGSKWEMYDALIEGIPAGLTAEEILICESRTMVCSGMGCGIAMTLNSGTGPSLSSGDLTGRPLRDVASLVRSWNFADASVGAAAMNAWYNSKEHISAAKARISADLQPAATGKKPVPEGSCYTQTEDAFLCYQEPVKGRKVAVIGHFAYLEKRYRDICELSILERDPKEGDLPDTACEYILGDQDYVFITGSALINKSLPRLLELSAGARVILCGPSTVMSDALFAWGVDDLAGFMVTDADLCRECAAQGGPAFFRCGKMVRLVREAGK